MLQYPLQVLSKLLRRLVPCFVYLPFPKVHGQCRRWCQRRLSYNDSIRWHDDKCTRELLSPLWVLPKVLLIYLMIIFYLLQRFHTILCITLCHLHTVVFYVLLVWYYEMLCQKWRNKTVKSYNEATPACYCPDCSTMWPCVCSTYMRVLCCLTHALTSYFVMWANMFRLFNHSSFTQVGILGRTG